MKIQFEMKNAVSREDLERLRDALVEISGQHAQHHRTSAMHQHTQKETRFYEGKASALFAFRELLKDLQFEWKP